MHFVTYSVGEGLGNRLRIHLVAHAFALRCKAPLIVKWPVVQACGASYGDLFLPFKGIIDSSSSPYGQLILRGLRRNRIRINHEQSPSIIDVDHLPCPKFGLVDFGEVFKPFGYEDDGRFLGRYKTNVLQALTPVPEVSKAICRLQAQATPTMIGIHIRRGDFHISFPHLLQPLEFYDQFMAIVSEALPSISFFISHDDDEFVAPILNKFRTVTSNRQIRQSDLDAYSIFGYKNYCNRDTVAGVREALVDMLMLSSSNLILGAPGSSFSALAAFLGDTKLITPVSSSKNRAEQLAREAIKHLNLLKQTPFSS